MSSQLPKHCRGTFVVCCRSMVVCAVAGAAGLGLSVRTVSASGAVASIIPTTADVIMNGELSLENHPVLDTWDMSEGAYNPDTAGPAPNVIMGSSIGALTAPAMSGSIQEKVMFGGHGTTVLDTDVYCEEFFLNTHRVLRISGDVTIYATKVFKIENHGHIELDEGARLTVYIGMDAHIQDQSHVNMNTWDPRRVTFVNLGSKKFFVQNQVQVCASFVSPGGGGAISDGSDVYGWYVGSDLQIKNQSGLHVPGGGTLPVILPSAAVLFD